MSTFDYMAQLLGLPTTKENPNHDPTNGQFTSGAGGGSGASEPKKYPGRARPGGETGMNQEQYRGGQFLPNTTLPKGTHSGRGSGKPRKEEVSPYKYDVAPTPTARPIYGLLSNRVRHNRTTDTLEAISLTEQQRAYLGTHVAGHEPKDLIAAYNSGQRWIEPKK